MRLSIGETTNDWTPKDVQEEKDEQNFRIIAKDLVDPGQELTKRDIYILLAVGIFVTIGWAFSKVL